MNNLTTLQAADIEILYAMSLSDDVRQQAALEIIANNKPLETALRHARAQVKRDNQSCGFEHLDAVMDGFQSLHDLIAAADPPDVLEYRSRWAELDAQSESVLDLMQRGTRCLSLALGVTQRRIQQRNKKQIDRARSESDFRAGKVGQGGLFGFGGEVAL
jgi:hypothetical protein